MKDLITLVNQLRSYSSEREWFEFFVGCCLLALLPEVWVLSENGRKNERKYLRLILRLIAGIVYLDQTQEEQICENHGSWNIRNQSPIPF